MDTYKETIGDAIFYPTSGNIRISGAWNNSQTYVGIHCFCLAHSVMISQITGSHLSKLSHIWWR